VASHPPIVLLHGWGFGPSVFESFSRTLGLETDVLTPALSGYDGVRIEHAAEIETQEILDLHVRTVVEAMLVWSHGPTSNQPAILVGWSMGGLVALRVAQRHPEWVDHVVLLTSLPLFVQAHEWPAGWHSQTSEDFLKLLDGDPEGAIRRLAILSAHGDENGPRVRRLLLKSTTGATGDVLSRDMRLLLGTDLRSAMRALARPVRCILGERDQVLGPHSNRALESLLSQGAITTVPGTGHAPFLSQPEWVARQVLS